MVLKELTFLKNFKFVGGRILKTGVAVFLTAIICEALNWPPVFAVITAIVTIEPTVSDSIKKGVIRFPASAIGSFYAVLFISLFGNSPITYTLAAVFTITTCAKLKLDAGLLVATLTSVAMVEVVHDNFLISFLIRLGTTTIGLGVSTIVNMFILPPDYQNDARSKVQQLAKNTSLVIETLFQQIIKGNSVSHMKEGILIEMKQDFQKAEQLTQLQHNDVKYYSLNKQKDQDNVELRLQLDELRMIHYHLNRLVHLPLEKLEWTEYEQELILEKVNELVYVLQHPLDFDSDIFQRNKNQLMELFWLDNFTAYRQESLTEFPPEVIVLYELLSIYEIVDNYLSTFENESGSTKLGTHGG